MSEYPGDSPEEGRTSPADSVDDGITPNNAGGVSATHAGDLERVLDSGEAPEIFTGVSTEASTDSEPLLFQSFTLPEIKPPVRIPHFGHLCLLFVFVLIGLACTGIAFAVSARFHFLGIDLSAKSTNNIRFVLGTELMLYLVTFLVALVVFPKIWGKGYFAGLQWRGKAALQRFWPLAATSVGCFALATMDELLLPGPANAPIEKMFRTPGAAWLLLGFGVTLAPFFEEMFFRGFLLPALCTAWDWTDEKMAKKQPPPLGDNGHPQWSFAAMVFGSIVTSVLFAGVHVAQQGHSLGPFLLLIVVSLILCTVRIKMRSLAASTIVHAGYNFCIFALTLVATGGFQHLDKM